MSDNNYKLVEDVPNLIEYQNNDIIIRFVYNSKEQNCTCWIWRIADFPIEISNSFLIDFYKSERGIDNKSIKLFALGINDFFKEEGKKLLGGDVKEFNLVEKFVTKISKKYTESLSTQKYVFEAKEAWEAEDYEKYLEVIKKIRPNELTKSLKLKSEIAIKRLKY